MLTLIVGGSASGKSAFAENYAMEAGENRIYIATMQRMAGMYEQPDCE